MMDLKKLSFAAVLFCGLTAAPVFAADELCPDIEKSRPDAPKDMASVQADIERLTLCVERAKLLKQLDDVSRLRKDMLDKMKNPAPTGGISTGMGMIPPLPVSALPPLNNTGDTRNLKAGEIRIHGPGGSPLDNTPSLSQTVQSLATPEWKVRKIWGQGAEMHAQLSNGGGTLINVVKGDPLPGGGSVESVSVKGVATSQNSKITDLSWDSGAASSSASGAPISSGPSSSYVPKTAP